MSKYKLQINTSKFSYIGAESDDLEELVEMHNLWAKNDDGTPVGILTKNSLPKSKVQSFNEGVEVDKIGFSYFNNDKKLLSPSSWFKQFQKPFNADMIAGQMAKAYEIDEEEIKKCWKEKGNLSADLGTVFHGALEFREKYKILGSNIVEAKQQKLDKENETRGKKGLKLKDTKIDDPSLLKHPLAKNIVLEFEKLNKIKGDVFTEIFVTDIKNGRCGIIDRLVVTGEKRCSIIDFKFNVEAEEKSSTNKLLKPYDGLDSTKISQYQLKMSYYAEILEQTGWTVDKLQAFVYDKKWKRYEFDKLEIK